MRDSDLKDVLLWLLGRRRRFRITGPSMQPLLAAGDEILVDRYVYRRQAPNIGDIVVAAHPDHPGLQIVKRIAAVVEDDRFQLVGDNPDPARNSSCFVSRSLILGQVTSRFG